jgi:microcystin degradation protein MlrC
MKPRVLHAGLYHETHTFLAETTAWGDFEITLGGAVLAREGDQSPTDGFLEVARSAGWEVTPTIDARAPPGGTVEDTAFERFWSEFESRARPALEAGVDACFVVLHGAMVTQSQADPEGEFLARLRALPGALHLPIFGVIDLHASVTARMCSHANGLVAYRKNPHTDAKAAAARAARLLERCLRDRRIPRMALCRLPIVWAPPATGTDADPMLSLGRFAEEAERGDPGIWAFNVVPGFAFADVPDTGASLSIVSVAGPERARPKLEAGARLAWSLRERGSVPCPSADTVVAGLAKNPRGPALLVEPADNIGGGAPGDGTGVLRALLAHGIERSLVVINDPLSVGRLAGIPRGGTLRLAIGGRGWRGDPGPVELDATLVSRSDGAFTLEDPHSHLASMSGIHCQMGPCAVIRHRGVTVLLTSRKTPPFDLGQLRSQGLEPRDFAAIGVKAAVAHRAAYDPIAGASFYVDTPGPCSSNLASFPYRRLRRPVYPLDPVEKPSFEFS